MFTLPRYYYEMTQMFSLLSLAFHYLQSLNSSSFPLVQTFPPVASGRGSPPRLSPRRFSERINMIDEDLARVLHSAPSFRRYFRKRPFVEKRRHGAGFFSARCGFGEDQEAAGTRGRRTQKRLWLWRTALSNIRRRRFGRRGDFAVGRAIFPVRR